ncbi:RNA polymerase sigma factor, sigma-70 family protein [Delftia acidovorans]|uniref:sigma-70 family RNA polymerase sigma factor n=1 Tax=Delftia acidovorans TaxID=80866 RepID=UPI00050625F3|nr:sigma-70 family RNA polymerase sigma factor [Delftia acidovorans]KFJ10639.1 RNA polymerase sigma factor, sigma-70 family protein [Delftia acidovorans]QQB52869.1 sigma-70 family RNA polymerase sigma factor [Delftia acidovorans]
MYSLYQNHHPWLESLLRKRLGNRDDAADLAQDTFVRLLRSPLPQQDIREPRRYLATIARGLVADLFRRRTLEQSYLDYLAQLPQSLAPSPEEQAIVQQTLLDVDRMLQGLPPKVREAFVLAQFEELSYPEIAQRLGVSLRTVSNYLTRAMEHCCLVLA